MTVTGKMERYAEQLESSQERYGLVVDGASLHLIMPVEENKKLLFQVFTYQFLLNGGNLSQNEYHISIEEHSPISEVVDGATYLVQLGDTPICEGASSTEATFKGAPPKVPP